MQNMVGEETITDDQIRDTELTSFTNEALTKACQQRGIDTVNKMVADLMDELKAYVNEGYTAQEESSTSISTLAEEDDCDRHFESPFLPQLLANFDLNAQQLEEMLDSIEGAKGCPMAIKWKLLAVKVIESGLKKQHALRGAPFDDMESMLVSLPQWTSTDLIEENPYAEFFAKISPYEHMKVEDLKAICKERGIKMGSEKRKAFLCMLLLTDDKKKGRETSEEDIRQGEGLRRDLVCQCMRGLRGVLPPATFKMVVVRLLEWVKRDSEFCSSRTFLQDRMQWLKGEVRSCVRLEEENVNTPVKDLCHELSYNAIKQVELVVKQSILVVNYVGKQHLRWPNNPIPLCELQMWRFLNADSLSNMYRLEDTAAIDILSRQTSKEEPSNLSSVFDLKPDEICLEGARQVQQEAFEAINRHFRLQNINPSSQRPTQDQIERLLRGEMHAVQDLLRSFFLNIKASYPWREWTFTSPPQNSVEDCLKRLQEISASRSSALLGLSDRAAIVVIPTGAGKSLLMLLTPFAILDPATHSTRRVLYISPNTSNRDQLASQFAHNGNVLLEKKMLPGQEWLPSWSVLPSDAKVKGGGGKVDIPTQANVVISNIQQLTYINLAKTFTRDHFDLIIVDEAHHDCASSYKAVREYFSMADVVLMTATPFRGDRYVLQGKVVYKNCSFERAIKNVYVKNVVFEPVPISGIDGIDENGKGFSLQGIGEMLEAGRRNSYQHAASSSKLIREATILTLLARLKAMRAISGYNHQAIVQASDQGDAEDLVVEISSHPDAIGLVVACIHSGDLPEDSRFKGEGGAGDSSELGRRMAALKSGNIDIVVHVGQLVEGFDHPPLSICAIFKAFRCIGSYMQFVGRAVRHIKDRSHSDADNTAYVIAPLLLGYQTHWDVYKEERQDAKGELDGKGKKQNIQITDVRCSDPTDTARPPGFELQYFVAPRGCQVPLSERRKLNPAMMLQIMLNQYTKSSLSDVLTQAAAGPSYSSARRQLVLNQ